ncbi:hypothetical protein [Microcoleus sp. K5-D4]
MAPPRLTPTQSGSLGMAGGLGVWDLVWLEIWVGGDRGERAL